MKDVSVQEIFEHSMLTEPEGFLRLYYSNEVKLFFVHNFKYAHSAATAMGCSHKSIQEAANEFVDSAKRVLAKTPERTYNERKAIRANAEALQLLNDAIVKWQEATVCGTCGNTPAVSMAIPSLASALPAIAGRSANERRPEGRFQGRWSSYAVGGDDP